MKLTRVTGYRTTDGTVFESRKAAAAHEQGLTVLAAIKVKMAENGVDEAQITQVTSALMAVGLNNIREMFLAKPSKNTEAAAPEAAKAAQDAVAKAATAAKTQEAPAANTVESLPGAVNAAASAVAAGAHLPGVTADADI